MGYRASASGLVWPVPREDLDALEVLELEWTPGGRVVVRWPTPAVPPSAPRPATHRVLAPAWRHVPEAAPVRLRLAWMPESMAPPEHRSQTARDKVTWLGIGALVGIALAGSVVTAPSPRVTAGRYTPINGTSPDPTAPSALSFSGADVSPVATTALPGPTFRPETPPATSPQARPVAAAIPMDARQDATPPAARPTQARGSRGPAARLSSKGGARTPALPRTPPPVVRAVMREIRRYEAAYTRMDAAALLAVWPAADRQAFVRHFTGLREQRLQLGGCVVESPADTASVTCRGTLRFRPRIGDHTTRTVRGPWRFALERRASGTWAIAEVQAPDAAHLPSVPHHEDAQVAPSGAP